MSARNASSPASARATSEGQIVFPLPLAETIASMVAWMRCCSGGTFA